LLQGLIPSEPVLPKQGHHGQLREAKDLPQALRPGTGFLSLWLCATDALAIAAGEQATPVTSVTQTSKCFLLNLQSAAGRGTFVFLFGPCEEDSVDSLVMLLIEELFAAMEKRGFGAPAEHEYDFMEIGEQLMREEILERARFRSAREGLVTEIEIAYIDHCDMMAYAEFEDTEMKEVPLLSISPETELEFRIYLKMNMNRRYLRYVNERRRLSADQSARLTAFGIRSVFVEGKQYELYLMHTARSQVDGELKKRGLRLIKKKQR
jgi:hypothetical protein